MEMPSETKSTEVSIMKQHVAALEDHPHSHMTVEQRFPTFLTRGALFRIKLMVFRSNVMGGKRG